MHYHVTERLPDGRVRTLARCRRYDEAVWEAQKGTWAVLIEQVRIPLEGHRSDPNALAGGSPSQESWGYSIAVDRRCSDGA